MQLKSSQACSRDAADTVVLFLSRADNTATVVLKRGWTEKRNVRICAMVTRMQIVIGNPPGQLARP